MIWLTLAVVLSVLQIHSEAALLLKGSEIWATRDIKWEKAPPEYNPNLSSGSATILYFRSDGRFGMIHCRLNKGQNYMVVSLGDGQVVYEGFWKPDGDEIIVRYRLMYRTVSVIGEKLPGPEISSAVQLKRAGGGQSISELMMNDLVFAPFADKLNGNEIQKEFFHFPELISPMKK
ncbi:MAG: hypothetical protein LAP85_29520 [Acidobacteriia bacterium]|nr:hypothetical protein [Terriglobia bacterium]